MSRRQWTLRDLDSRNGTIVGGERDPRRLRAAGRRRDPHRPHRSWPSSTTCRRRFPIRSTRAPHCPGGRRADAPASRPPETSTTTSVLEAYEPTTITHRRGQTPFPRAGRGGRKATGDPEDGPRRGQALPAGLRAGQGARRRSRWPTLALDGLFEGTQVDAGAVLLLPPRLPGRARGDDLEVVASRSDSPHSATTACRTSWPRP